jgi:hypothetical protein
MPSKASQMPVAHNESIPARSKPARIQRQPMESEPPVHSISSSDALMSPQTKNESPQSPTAPNLESLADQVFAILRSRLRMEWERLRR